MDLTHALWDPESLFQIADYDNSEAVQCVGQASSKHNARCRWNIDEYDHDEIYDILGRLARKSPADVETADLVPLARLCLCRKYHSRQVGEVVQRWKTVVKRAVSYSNASSRESTPQSDDGDSTRQRCLTELGHQDDDSSVAMDVLIRRKISTLTDETSRLSRDLAKTKLSLAGAERDGQEFRRNFQDSQEQLRKSRQYAHWLAEKIRKMAVEHRNVLGQQSTELADAKKHLEESRGNETKHRISISNLREEVAKLKDEAAKEKKSREESEDRDKSLLKEAEERLNGMRDDCARLTAALANKTESLQQSQTELEASREAKTQLEREVQFLNERIAEMNQTFDQDVVETRSSDANPGEMKKKARQHDRFGILSVWRSRRRDAEEARPPVH